MIWLNLLEQEVKLLVSNKIYNILKWIALIALPALSTLVFALSNIWNFDATPVIGTIAAIETFIGSLIGVSTYQYNRNKSDGQEDKKDDSK